MAREAQTQALRTLIDLLDANPALRLPREINFHWFSHDTDTTDRPSEVSLPFRNDRNPREDLAAVTAWASALALDPPTSADDNILYARLPTLTVKVSHQTWDRTRIGVQDDIPRDAAAHEAQTRALQSLLDLLQAYPEAPVPRSIIIGRPPPTLSLPMNVKFWFIFGLSPHEAVAAVAAWGTALAVPVTGNTVHARIPAFALRVGL
jgi:hypothetical protein